MYIYNLQQRFERILARFSSKVAISFGPAEQWTYAALAERSRALAGLFSQHGVSAGDIVAISGSKCRDAYAALIACLYLGAPYVMLDPDAPTERVGKILRSCRAKVLFAEAALLDRLAKICALSDIERLLTGQVVAPANGMLPHLLGSERWTGSHPAYIMFTSGSTGEPKGALMTHGNVANLIDWSRTTYSIVPEDRLTNVNPLYFDNSVFDIYSALFNGACLVSLNKEETRDPQRLVTRVDAEQCTIWFSVPSLMIFLQTMRAVDGRHLRSVRRFIFGGEGYPKAKLKALYDLYGDLSEVYNVYGPTECTCICSSYRITAADLAQMQGFPPLGSIAPNFSYLILNDDLQPVSRGEAGELCLLGPNVGLGYINDRARTEQSFVQNPLNTAYREIMYRTGDRVQIDAIDGKLHILGRADNQIKHMGYRVELEEIETALHRVDDIEDAVALHATVNGLSRIIAVIASKKEVPESKIRQQLREIIPDYMMPSTFHRETELPKNPNGKTDRRRLAKKYLQALVGQ
jgi:D-alanine--poly(phosphoribitol) ligase subunit 1